MCVSLSLYLSVSLSLSVSLAMSFVNCLLLLLLLLLLLWKGTENDGYTCWGLDTFLEPFIFSKRKAHHIFILNLACFLLAREREVSGIAWKSTVHNMPVLLGFVFALDVNDQGEYFRLGNFSSDPLISEIWQLTFRGKRISQRQNKNVKVCSRPRT